MAKPKECPFCHNYMVPDGKTQEPEGMVEHYYCPHCDRIYAEIVENAASWIIDDCEELWKRIERGKWR